VPELKSFNAQNTNFFFFFAADRSAKEPTPPRPMTMASYMLFMLAGVPFVIALLHVLPGCISPLRLVIDAPDITSILVLCSGSG
jgi:hypothetical protein